MATTALRSDVEKKVTTTTTTTTTTHNLAPFPSQAVQLNAGSKNGLGSEKCLPVGRIRNRFFRERTRHSRVGWQKERLGDARYKSINPRALVNLIRGSSINHRRPNSCKMHTRREYYGSDIDPRADLDPNCTRL